MMRHQPYGAYERFVKRALDCFCAILIVVLLFWLYAAIALIIRIKMGSPVVFRQERPGRNEKIFRLLKFRTMSDDRDENGKLLPDGERLTGFGRWLRKSSLDELPELFNIIKGDMSFVGPRPLLTEYLPYYTEEEKHRHDVRPGLTGLAQVNGRNYVDWDRRLAMDVEYVSRITFLTDVKILLKTVFVVFTHKGVAENTIEVESNLADERRKNMSRGDE